MVDVSCGFIVSLSIVLMLLLLWQCTGSSKESVHVPLLTRENCLWVQNLLVDLIFGIKFALVGVRNISGSSDLVPDID